MSSITFSPGTVVPSSWLNDVDTVTYKANSNFAGAVTRTYLQQASDKAINPKDYGAVGNGVTDDSAALAAAFLAAKTNAYGIDLGTYSYFLASTVSLSGYASFNIFSRGAAFIGPSATSLTCLFEIKDSQDVNIYGRLGIAGNYNLNLTSGLWIHATSAVSNCNFINIDSLAFSGCKIAYRIGDATLPDKVVSEITISNGYTYGCPTAVQCEGAETVVNFIGCTLNSDVGNGTAPWIALTPTTIRSIGAAIRITGGEINHAAQTLGSTIEVQPITSGVTGNTWGWVECSNVPIESASQLAISANPGAISSPTQGRIAFSNCGGFHSQNAFAFVQTEATYAGDIVFNFCKFFSSVTRTQPNIICANALTNVYCDENSFGTNFLTQLNGVTGGTPHFRNKLIFAASVPNNTITAGVMTIIKYQNLNPFADSLRYEAGYSTTTGQLTIPAGGLTDVNISVGFNAGAATVTDVFVFINGTQSDSGIETTRLQQFSCFIKRLNPGDVVDIRCQPSGANITPTASNLNNFKIMASN